MAEGTESDPELAGDWKEAEGEVYFVTLRISVKCKHCGQAIPLNGPSRKLQCDSCLESSSAGGLSGALSDARKGLKELGSRFEYQLSKNPNPECLGCGARVRYGDLLKKHGATTTFDCQECGLPSATYPVPSWLAGQFAGALQIFGGAAPNEEQAPSATNLALSEESRKPVLMNCPGCGGGLKIGVEAERTTACEYCSASVFIPDALWKTLHPAKTQEYWTISYTKKSKGKSKGNSGESNSGKNKGEERTPAPAARPRASASHPSSPYRRP